MVGRRRFLCSYGSVQAVQTSHVFFFPSFQEEILLCPVDALKKYIRRSEPLRVQSSSRLFLGMVAPHKPVVLCTVARWLKTMLKASGVDTSVFASHSFRGATTSKAAMDILKAADWSSESSFPQVLPEASSRGYFRQDCSYKHSLSRGLKLLRTR